MPWLISFSLDPSVSRPHKYILIGWNLLYLAVLAACFVLLGPSRRIPWDAVHSAINSSTTFDDLRPRAQHLLAALQHADKEMQSAHDFALWFCVLGVTWIVVNMVLLQLFTRRHGSLRV